MLPFLGFCNVCVSVAPWFVRSLTRSLARKKNNILLRQVTYFMGWSAHEIRDLDGSHCWECVCVCVCALGLKSLGRSSCTCNSNTACAIVRDPWILSFWSHRILEATFGNWLASRWSNQLLKNSGYSSIFFTFSLSLSRFLSSCLSLSLSLSLSLIIFGCIISKTDRCQNHIPYRQLPTLVIFRLFHFVFFCLNRLHPVECTHFVWVSDFSL